MRTREKNNPLRALRRACACLLLSTTVAMAADSLGTTYQLDIPAQPLNDALQALALASQHKLFYDAALVKGITSPALKGKFTTEEALKKLLAETQLRYEITDDGLVLVRPIDVPAASTSQTRSSEPASDRDQIEEIVVTAQKRVEKLRDVPLPVTAVASDSLLNTNQVSLTDYYTRVPALNLTQGNRGEPQLALRGVTTGSAGNPVVGILVDDIPFGASTGNGGGFIAPDLDPSDLVRIEVLRGPQGTLYGASSMGGLLKYVTVEPSTAAFSGRLQVGLQSVENSDGLGSVVRGAINTPVGDNFAFRVSAYTRDDPGYIDNHARGLDAVNERSASGGLLSALWAPSSDTSVRFSALLQSSDRDGANEIFRGPGARDLDQIAAPKTGTYSSEAALYSLTARTKLAGLDLVSVSSYADTSWDSSVDVSNRLGYLPALFGVPANGFAIDDHNDTTKWTQEVRLSGVLNTHLDWLVGVFYTDEHTDWLQLYRAIDADSGAYVGSAGQNIFGPSDYEEISAFANVTLRLTDAFDVQFGGRQSRSKQRHEETGSGLAAGRIEPIRSKDDTFTYSITPRFKLSPDVMMYARVATGFRSGGPNNSLGVGDFAPEYKSDSTTNYELGIKADLFDRALYVDASVYRIDWSDLQLSLTDPASGFGYGDNAGSARVQGVELSVSARPSDRLTLTGWVAYTDAVLDEDLPALTGTVGFDGDRLPFSPKVSGSLAADYEFATLGSFACTFGTSVSYVGDRLDDFSVTPGGRIEYPSYSMVNAYLRFAGPVWNASLFVNNATDRRALIAVTGDEPNAFIVNQPRTIGMTLSREF